MKKTIYTIALALLMSSSLTSCYTYTMTVGSGPKSNVEVKKMNHYLIYGLAPIKTADPKEMAAGASDYSVTVKHTFVDGLINALTWGIYTPTTTVVTK